MHDRDGKARRTNTTTPAAFDPFLAEVLADAPPERPRSWFDVLESRWDKAEGTVRHHLAVADPGQVHALRERVRDAALRGSEPASIPLREAVLVTLAVDGLVSTMFRWRELRTHNRAIRALADRIDSEMPGRRPRHPGRRRRTLTSLL